MSCCFQQTNVVLYHAGQRQTCIRYVVKNIVLRGVMFGIFRVQKLILYQIWRKFFTKKHKNDTTCIRYVVNLVKELAPCIR